MKDKMIFSAWVQLYISHIIIVMQGSPQVLADSPKKQSSTHSLSKTKVKFKIGKVRELKENKNKIGNYPQFNDPLYEYLDGEVHNREEHNFGPWISPQRSKSRERQRRNRVQSDLSPIRMRGAFTRYQQQQPEVEQVGLPIIIQRLNQVVSLQQFKVSSLQLSSLYDSSLQKSRKHGQSLNKRQLFLKWKDAPFLYTRSSLDHGNKRSNVIYNYCLQQEQTNLLNRKFKQVGNKIVESYVKLSSQKKLQPMINLAQLTNQNLIRELREHRVSKVK